MSGKPQGHGSYIRIFVGPILSSQYRILCPPLVWPHCPIILTAAHMVRSKVGPSEVAGRISLSLSCEVDFEVYHG